MWTRHCTKYLNAHHNCQAYNERKGCETLKWHWLIFHFISTIQSRLNMIKLWRKIRSQLGGKSPKFYMIEFMSEDFVFDLCLKLIQFFFSTKFFAKNFPRFCIWTVPMSIWFLWDVYLGQTALNISTLHRILQFPRKPSPLKLWITSTYHKFYSPKLIVICRWATFAGKNVETHPIQPKKTRSPVPKSSDKNNVIVSIVDRSITIMKRKKHNKKLYKLNIYKTKVTSLPNIPISYHNIYINLWTQTIFSTSKNADGYFL